MDDNTRKSTADEKRPSSSAEQDAVKRCDVCHGPLKPPVHQLASRRWPFSSQQRVACSDCGDADVAEEAINIVSLNLGYFKVPCPNEVYGCGGAASRDAATHAAVCAHAPRACPGCAFLGSPAQLVRHLTDTAGPHAWPVHDFEYGNDLMLDRTRTSTSWSEDDGGVFLLAVGPPSSASGVTPVLGQCTVPCWRSRTCRVPSCSTPSSSVSVHPGSELHLPIRVCIDRKN